MLFSSRDLISKSIASSQMELEAACVIFRNIQRFLDSRKCAIFGLREISGAFVIFEERRTKGYSHVSVLVYPLELIELFAEAVLDKNNGLSLVDSSFLFADMLAKAFEYHHHQFRLIFGYQKKAEYLQINLGICQYDVRFDMFRKYYIP